MRLPTLEHLLDARVAPEIVTHGPTASVNVWVEYGLGWSAPWADWLAMLKLALSAHNDGWEGAP
jgi:hypothetical protein